jgi:hypothetical protein
MAACIAAGGLSAWQTLQAFGTSCATVLRGFGTSMVWSGKRSSTPVTSGGMWQETQLADLWCVCCSPAVKTAA